MNIRTKILIFILSSSIFIFIVAIGIVTYSQRQYAIETSKKTADLYSSESAHIAETIFEADMEIVKTLKNAISAFAERDKYPAERLNKILEKLLISNPQFLSVWTSWELSFIDKDWEYPFGRMRTSTLFNEGRVNIFIDSVEIEGDNIEGLYYKFKIGELKELVTDPYFYTYSNADTGTSFLETSIAVPLLNNREFVGVVGIDASLERFNDISENKTPLKGSYIFILSNNGMVVNHPKRDFHGDIVTEVLPAYAEFDILENVKNGEKFSFIIDDDENGKEYVSFSPIKIGKTNTPWSIGFVVPLDVIMKDSLNSLKISLIVTFIGLLILSIAIILILEMLTRPIKKTTDILQELEKGNIDEDLRIDIHTKDEMGKMATSVDNLIVSLNNTAKFAKEIGKGNLNAEYKIQSNNDVLGMALIEMKKNLLIAKEQEEKRKEENEKLSWRQTGITEVNEILRVENEDINKMSYRLLKYLVSYLNANQGGFYTVIDNKIKLSAAFAFNRKKQLDAVMEFGEGLVGRCAKEQKTINITNLPEGYLSITSGLGDESPKNLVLTPLIFEGIVYGIIEIASFNEFQSFQISFIEQVSERIGSSISNLQKTLRTAELLKDSQEQSKLLASKEQEIERRMNALNFAQKEVELSEIETAGLIDAISKEASIVEYDMRGNIINIAGAKLTDGGLNKEEIIGVNQSEFAIEAKENPEWYEKFWSDLNNGIIRKRIFEFKAEIEDIIFEETYIPILDKKGKPYKVINFGLDITENIRLKEEIEKLKKNK